MNGQREQIMVTSGYGPKREEIPVVDAVGGPIRYGDVVRVVTPTHWLAAEELVKVIGGTSGDGGPNLNIRTTRGSYTGVNASNVLSCGTDPELERQWTLAWEQARLAGVNGEIAVLLGKRATIQSRIRDLDTEGVLDAR